MVSSKSLQRREVRYRLSRDVDTLDFMAVLGPFREGSTYSITIYLLKTCTTTASTKILSTQLLGTRTLRVYGVHMPGITCHGVLSETHSCEVSPSLLVES